MSISLFRISLYLPLFLKQKILKLKTMKRILFMLFFLPVYLYGQSAGPFEKELSILQKALNSKNAEDLKPYLAENFTIAGFKGEKAYQILTAVLQQYPPVQSVSLIKADTTDYFDLQVRITCPDTIRIQNVQLDREHRFTEINLARIQISNSAVTSPLRIASKDFLEIPFRQVGKLILIGNVRINGKKGNFLVDTGAQSIIIPFNLQNHLPIFEITYGAVNLKTAFDSGAENNAISPESLEKIPSRFYKTQKETKLTGAYKESIKTMKIRFPRTRIQNFLFKNMHCITTSLSHLNIDAIAGYELMKHHRLSLNYRRKEIRIY